MEAVTVKQKKVVKRKPRLRFAKFEGGWVNLTLGDILSFKNGINADKERYGRGVKFINVLDIINNHYITYDNIVGSVEITEKEFEKNQVTYGDILFQRSSETREEVGQANVYLDNERDSVFGGFVIRGKKKADYQPIFMNYLLKTWLARKEITTKSGGSTRYNVGQDTLRAVVIYSPSLPEQKKIASFLSAVDKKIQQLTHKKELLEQYKKGVMQKLFSQEIRFKDESGEDYPDWEEKRLGKYIDEFREKSTSNNQFEVLTSSNKGLMKQNDYFGDNRLTERENIGFNIIPDGYLTYRSRSDNRKFSFNMNTLGFTGIISIYYPVFKIKDGASKFILELTNFYNHFIGRYSVGTSQTVLSLNDLRRIKFRLPCGKEQKKIAAFLEIIDKKIEKATSQITQTQQFKKGLLQQMFV